MREKARTITRRALAPILFSALTASAGFAQTTTATVTGLVVDAQHLPIPGATLTIQDLQRGAQRTLTSADNGTFEFAGLLPGDYRLTTSLAGFATTQVDLRLQVNQRLRVDVTLQPRACLKTSSSGRRRRCSIPSTRRWDRSSMNNSSRSCR